MAVVTVRTRHSREGGNLEYPAGHAAGMGDGGTKVKVKE